MPLPLIVPIVLAIGGVAGLGLGVAGAADISKAKGIAKSAEQDYGVALHVLERDRTAFERRASLYGTRQLQAADQVVARFVRQLDRLGQKSSVTAGQLLDGLQITPAELQAYRGLSVHAAALLEGGVKAAGAGMAASTASVGLVGLLASAGTGAQIAGLSGVAAESATLAWLGGGTLASGGGGMAAGSMVLGGIAVAPLLLIGGFVLASEGEKALTKAVAYRARVRRAEAEFDALRGFIAKAWLRVGELDDALAELVARAGKAMDALDRLVFSLSRPQDAARFQVAGQLVRAVADLLRTPVLDADGELSSASADVLVRTKPLLNPKADVAPSQPAPVRLDVRSTGELLGALFLLGLKSSTVKN